MTTDERSGKGPDSDIASLRSRGFQAINQHLASAQVLANGLGELDARIFLATEQTVDDRNAMLEAARRLALLLDGEAVR